MKTILMQFVLLLVMVSTVSAQSSPTVDLMSDTYGPNGISTLDVRQWSSPDSRLKYEEIGEMLARSAESDAVAGMTGFDGSSITLNAPPVFAGPDMEPLRVTAANSHISGGQSSRAAVSQATHDTHGWVLPVMGPRPYTQRHPIGHYRIGLANAVGRTAQGNVQASPRVVPLPTSGGGASFGHPHR